ncbi:hypothetical protein VMCG_06168 [Cytospora schulzeri]|uniref:C2H2-type domain-containing protein n=1 Tax=Cytospora schulzeri TaxID=448051 RepID=A0A423W9B9_9PEZI|nr:hypothetical protein VMCG_06168 [Valsa malicola]
MAREGSTTLLRGFKISVAVLDVFLAANGVDRTYGTPPFYKDHPENDPISGLLYTRVTQAGGTADKNRFRVMIPSHEGHDNSTVAYVTWTWATVFAHREIDLDRDLPGEVPVGFEELRKEILSCGENIPEGEGGRIPDEGKVGLYMVHTYDSRGSFRPKVLDDRRVLLGKVPQYCDQCDAVFEEPSDAFDQRRLHLIEIHGFERGRNPLPDA